MRFRFLLIGIIAVLTSSCGVVPAHAQDRVWIDLNSQSAPKRVIDWEKSLRATWLINAVQDIAQTADFSAHGHLELNPLVKRWVDSKNLFEFGVISAGGCWLFDRGVQSIKGPTIRLIAYGLAAGIEILAVSHNHKLFKKGIPLAWVTFKLR